MTGSGKQEEDARCRMPDMGFRSPKLWTVVRWLKLTSDNAAFHRQASL